MPSDGPAPRATRAATTRTPRQLRSPRRIRFARSLAMPSRSFASRPAVALVGAAAAWGVGTAISKRAVEEVPPLLLLATQLAVSIVVLVVVMRLRSLPLRDPHASPLLSRLGILNPGIAYLLSLIGLTQIGASLSVLLCATEPVRILRLP